MSPQHWREIEEGYHAAKACEPFDREAVLARYSPSIRGQVLKMLEVDKEGDGSFLDRSAWDPVEAPENQMMVEGTLLGPYKIQALVGRGGMGHVYSAIDTRLNRKVAVKVCFDSFSDRFGREAHAIAALNHPSICTLFDVGPNYLVMEYLDGETLASRLRSGPLPLSEAMNCGVQIAEALSAAHAKNIIHRDLKPANIILSKAGLKLLDFGVCKSHLDAGLTSASLVVGTVAYMAPEQLEGIEATEQTDIYALGLILSEMAEGKNTVAVRAARHDTVPRELSHIIERCLARKPEDRWQSTGDLKRELQWAIQVVRVRRWPALSQPTRRAALGVAGATLAGAGFVLGRRLSQPRRSPSVRATIPSPGSIRSAALISPDGNMIVVSVMTSEGVYLFCRRLTSAGFSRLDGTKGGNLPFWSPDSKTIGFFAASRLMRISADGAGLLGICDVSNSTGATWGHGIILFGAVNALYQVPDTGGVPQKLAKLDYAAGEVDYLAPVFLSDRNRFLFHKSKVERDHLIAVHYLDSFDRKQPRRLVPLPAPADQIILGIDPRTSQEFLIASGSGRVLAYPFDVGHNQFTGEPRVLTEQQGVASVSETGVLVVSRIGLMRMQLVWRDRTGQKIGNLSVPGDYRSVFVSPDDHHVAVIKPSLNPGRLCIWMASTPSGQLEPFSDTYYTNTAAWSSDGRTLYYSDPWQQRLLRRQIDSNQKDEILAKLDDEVYLSDVASNLRYVAAELSGTSGKSRPAWMDLTSKKWTPVAASGPVGLRPTFSPNGKWLAFASTHTGRSEVYVVDFPAALQRKRVSVEGGRLPRWRHDGLELFFLAEDNWLMSIPLSPTETFDALEPRRLFQTRLYHRQDDATISPSRDGQRFLLIEDVLEGSTEDIEAVINWPGLS